MVHDKRLRLALITTSVQAPTLTTFAAPRGGAAALGRPGGGRAPDVLEGSDEAAMHEAGRLRELMRGLEAAGHRVDALLSADASLESRLSMLEPDVLIVDAESGARDAIEHVVMATRDAPRPIVLFTDEHDPAHVREALAAGVVAYVVAGLAVDRVHPVLDVAIARFEHERELRRQLADAQDRLASNDLVARAKLVMMKRHGLDEPQAHARLRTMAMNQSRPMREVARRLLEDSS